MLAIILIVVAVAILAVLGFAATRPDTFSVSRSVVIGAPPEKVFPLIDDLKAQQAWSPFEKDPAMKRRLGGAERGKGQVYEWDGNRQVGAGRIEITDSTPPSSVTMLLEMVRPFKARNKVVFALAPRGDGTAVTWTMSGRQPYMAKLMGMFVNCDAMVGREFEKGLASLKALAEHQPQP